MDIKTLREYKVPFKEIVVGDVFLVSDNYYMRIQSSENVNAANVYTGGVTRFADDEIVAPIDCYLAIE